VASRLSKRRIDVDEKHTELIFEDAIRRDIEGRPERVEEINRHPTLDRIRKPGTMEDIPLPARRRIRISGFTTYLGGRLAQNTIGSSALVRCPLGCALLDLKAHSPRSRGFGWISECVGLFFFLACAAQPESRTL
jgi:hypothetical protein